MFPGKGSNLFSKILLKKEDILKYARIKLKATRDKYVNRTLRELLSLVDGMYLPNLHNPGLHSRPLGAVVWLFFNSLKGTERSRLFYNLKF